MKAVVLVSCLMINDWMVAGTSYHHDYLDQQDKGTSNATSDWICHISKDYNSQGPSVVRFDHCKVSCDSSGNEQYLGYFCAVVTSVFFGSNLIPVKKFDTGEGMFFQWVLCIGIWLVGLAANCILDSPIFFSPTVIGGVFWATGNLLVVPIIKLMGLSIGVTVFNVTSMLTGWTIGMFVLKQEVACGGVSYGAVAIVVLSVIILAFVKSDGKLKQEKPSSLVGSKQGDCKTVSVNSSGRVIERSEFTNDESWVNKLGVWQRRLLGFALCVVTGVFFAVLFIPVQFLKLCDDPFHSCEDMNYVFGVYSGILMASTFYFAVYAAIMRNKPKIYPKVIFPGLISGIMWGVAMLSWFIANQHLSLTITYPLMGSGPGLVGSAWGIIVYREIRGWKNLSFYFVAFFCSLTGLILNGLSKCTIHC